MTLIQSRQIAKNASVVVLATFASRILGFIRDAVVATALGAGLSADAFFVAFRVPNVLRRLFAEGSMTMSFIPVFQRLRIEENETTAFIMARSTMIWLLAIVSIITILAEIFAEDLTALIAPGFFKNSGQLENTTQLMRICFPYILLISGAGLCMGILNSLGHFLSPALSPLMLNLCLIISAFIGWRLNLNVAYCLAWGVLTGGLCQFLFQLTALKTKGFTWRGKLSWRHPGVKRMGKLMLPTIFGAAVYQINTLFGTLLASFLSTGSISFLYYADRLVEFPLGVFGLAISTAALPNLSTLASTGNTEEFRDALSSTLRLTLFISLPAMAGLLALAKPIVLLLFGLGQFDTLAVEATAQAVIAFAFGLPFAALARSLASAFYARQNTRTPVIIAFFCMLVNIILSMVLMQILTHVGLALAVSIASAVNFFCLTLIMHKDIKLLLPLRSLIATAGLSFLVFAAAWTTSGTAWLWLILIPIWAILYILIAWILDMEEAQLVLHMFFSQTQLSRNMDSPKSSLK